MGIQILVADCDAMNANRLCEYLRENGHSALLARTGKECVDILKRERISVAIIDAILPCGDGFSVLSFINSLAERPAVIIYSSLDGEIFINQALALNADKYIVKPVPLEELRQCAEELALRPEKKFSHYLDELISNIFISSGISANLKGYHYLREAIKIVIDKPEVIGGLTKNLYPAVAEIFNTSAYIVERSMRHAITSAWSKGKQSFINTYFGAKLFDDEKPTNGEFIAIIAEKLLIRKIQHDKFVQGTRSI